MPNTLYDQGILVWSEHQAKLLRRLAAGEQSVEGVDWENLIDEVESVGRKELRACEDLLGEAMLHLLRRHARPQDPAAAQWQTETRRALREATRRYTESMRDRLRPDWQYRLAVLRAHLPDDEKQASTGPGQDCPFTLDQLLAKDAEPVALLRVLRAHLAAHGTPSSP